MSRVLGIHTPTEIKNLAINGALDFWQEKEGTTTTINTATPGSPFFSDMVKTSHTGSTVKNYSMVRSTDVPTVSESGFQSTYSTLLTVISAIPTLAAADAVSPFQYAVEGLDYAKIHSKTSTFGFWIKVGVAGTYSFALRNIANTRSYVTTFTASANTWEFKTITVTMDNQGSWLFDVGIGLIVDIGYASGSTYQTSTLNQWQNGIFVAASTATNWMATVGATIRVTQFSIVEGSAGFGPKGFQRAGKTIQQELAMCQRYYEKSYDISQTLGTVAYQGAASGSSSNADNTLSGRSAGTIVFKQAKRSAPIMVSYNPATGAANGYRDATAGANLSGSVDLASTTGARFNSGGAAAGNIVYVHWTADARL